MEDVSSWQIPALQISSSSQSALVVQYPDAGVSVGSLQSPFGHPGLMSRPPQALRVRATKKSVSDSEMIFLNVILSGFS